MLAIAKVPRCLSKPLYRNFSRGASLSPGAVSRLNGSSRYFSSLPGIAASKISVVSPIDGSHIESIPVSTQTDLDVAVANSKVAFQSWSALTLKNRAEIFETYRHLLKTNMSELAELVHKENGKTLSESIAEVEKSIEITDFACSIPNLIPSKSLEVSPGVSCQIMHEPLGVVSAITPFNFPNMVPHWVAPIALTCGNTMILKPSEKTPLSAIRMQELLLEAGVPKNVFQVVNGEKAMVEAICDHPDIKVVSFVGSTPVAKIVYQRATSTLKRALCLGGAKNHLLVLPGADPAMTASNVVASMSGCAGQRCMAASVMVAVGDVDAIIDQIAEKARAIVPGKDMGPVISPEAKARIEAYITQAEKDGATILVDGRHATVDGKEKGTYVGPTIITDVTPDMSVANEEIFGPVLSILKVPSIEEALKIENGSLFGNSCAVFTQHGGHAAEIVRGASAGMIGVNVGVPVPREPFSFGGWNDSKFGTGDITGDSSIHLWTQPKKVTTKWESKAGINWMS